MTEELDPRRKRLLFRSNHLGMRETDILFGGYARAHIASLNETELNQFEALLDEHDADLLAWVIGTKPVPEDHDNALMKSIIQFNKEMQ